MPNASDRLVVTGGAGFIGSHLTERLLNRGNSVVVVDNLSNGREEWIPNRATFVEGDLTDPRTLEKVLSPEIDRVYHLAASKVIDAAEPHVQFRENTTVTANVLRTMKDAGVTDLVYTSSSTVYGEAPRPTPEDFAPLEPISVYGASKLADEGLCSTYGHSHGFTVKTFRFANVVGRRLRGAVVPDFIEKLRNNPNRLEILGNGRQEKSYLHVSDCIDGLVTAVEDINEVDADPVQSFNLGTRTTTSVRRIADIVAEEMGADPTYEYTGGDRGWTGDVPKMRLSIEKLSALGWEPDYESDKAVRGATREVIEEL